MDVNGLEENTALAHVTFWFRKLVGFIYMACLFRLKKIEIYMNSAYDDYQKISSALWKLRVITIAYVIYALLYEGCHFVTQLWAEGKLLLEM